MPCPTLTVNSTSTVIVQIFLNSSLNANEQNLKTNKSQKTFYIYIKNIDIKIQYIKNVFKCCISN